jgi:hypothetical protein
MTCPSHERYDAWIHDACRSTQMLCVPHSPNFVCSCEYSTLMLKSSDEAATCHMTTPTVFLLVFWAVVACASCAAILWLIGAVCAAFRAHAIKRTLLELVCILSFLVSTLFTSTKVVSVFFAVHPDFQGVSTERRSQTMQAVVEILFIVAIASFATLIVSELQHLMYISMQTTSITWDRFSVAIFSTGTFISCAGIIILASLELHGVMHFVSAMFSLVCLFIFTKLTTRTRRQSFSNFVGDLRIFHERTMRVIQLSCTHMRRAILLYCITSVVAGAIWFIGRALVSKILLSHVTAIVLSVKDCSAVAIIWIITRSSASLSQCRLEQANCSRMIKMCVDVRKDLSIRPSTASMDHSPTFPTLTPTSSVHQEICGDIEFKALSLDNDGAITYTAAPGTPERSGSSPLISMPKWQPPPSPQFASSPSSSSVSPISSPVRTPVLVHMFTGSSFDSLDEPEVLEIVGVTDEPEFQRQHSGPSRVFAATVRHSTWPVRNTLSVPRPASTSRHPSNASTQSAVV